MVKLKVGDKVRSIENHPILGVSRRNVGVVVSVEHGNPVDLDVEVKYRHKLNTCIFQAAELTRISKVKVPKLNEIWSKRGRARLAKELEWREAQIERERTKLQRMLREKAALEDHLNEITGDVYVPGID